MPSAFASYALRIDPHRSRVLRWRWLSLGVLVALAISLWIAGVELWQWDLQLASSLGLDSLDSGVVLTTTPVLVPLVVAFAACLAWYVLGCSRSLVSAASHRSRVPAAFDHVQHHPNSDFRPPRMSLRA